MPNWCENELTVKGPAEELARFKETANHGEAVLSEAPFIPYPEHFRELDRIAVEYEKQHPGDWAGRPKDGFNQGGLDWCIEHWGTKWGFCDPVVLTETNKFLKYRFDSAWSPPCPLIKKMGEMFWTLKFCLKYWEEGTGFKGVFRVKYGTVTEDTNQPYHGSRGG